MKYLLALLTAVVLVPTLRPVDAFAKISLGDCNCDECGGTDCDAAGNCCVSGGGLEGGLTLTFFDAHSPLGGGDGADDGYFGIDRVTDGRFWIGYETAAKIDFMFRYSQYDEIGGGGPNSDFYDVELYDLEVSSDLCWECMSITPSVGARFGEVDSGHNLADNGGTLQTMFSGAGLTLGIELEWLIWDNGCGSQLAVISGGRYAMLVGDAYALENGDPSGATGELNDTTLEITELRAGLEWSRCCQFGGRFFVNGVWEHQFYNTPDGINIANYQGQSKGFGLWGPAFSVGVER